MLCQWLVIYGSIPLDNNSRTTVYLNISFTNSIYSLSAVDIGSTVLDGIDPLTYRIDPLSSNSLYVYATNIHNVIGQLYGYFIVIGS
ncbi:MAG: hypothetical protein SPF22_07720 [Candidatus Onthovivens sp.]|nr:hypothetical protein [Candidatus Onthovivens sp.]